jgi:hypothetical protein
MAKQIAKLLKTDVMADIDMPGIAQFLQSQGRRGDSILAHINPKEAMLLQNMGGAATSNPVTGLPEFYIDESGFDSSYGFNRGYDNINEYDPITEVSAGNFNKVNQNALDLEAAQRYSDMAASGYRETEPAKYIFSGGTAGRYAPSGYGQTITPDYLSKYNVSGDGGFGYSQAAGGADRFGTTPTTLDRFNVPNVAKGFDEAGFPTLPGAQGQDQSQQQPPSDGRNVFRRGADYLKETTGLSGNELARLGLAAGLGIQGALGSRDAAEQGRRARAEQEEIARPYRERGAELLAQAEGGQLTPQGQQSLQAMRARLAQGVEARGGVGAQQAQAQIENYRQQLIANQYDYGMKISNVGDQLMLGAIRTGLEADRYATQMTNNYYTNMARILVGMGTNENELKQITQSGNGGQ